MPDFNITDPIFGWALRSPDAVAIVERDKAISYHVLCVAVRHAALRFREAGWGPGDLIGVSIRGETSLHLVVALALARIGATQVTLSPNDPPAQRLSMAQSLGIKALVADHEHDRLGTLQHLAPENNWLSAVHSTPVAPDIRVPGGDRAWIIMQSSGTTAASKNIHVSHQFHRIRAERFKQVFGFQPGERFMGLSGLRFWTGISRAVQCLGDGGTFVVVPVNSTAQQLLSCMEQRHVTYLSCAPNHLHALLEECGGLVPRLPALRILRCAGATLPVSVLHAIRKRIAQNVYIDYGTNEAGGIAAATPAVLDRFPDSVGLPLPGIALEVVDEDDRPVPAGADGHLRVRGPGIDASVLGVRTEDEAPGFRGGWFYTGDTAMLNREGAVFLKGRSDEVMNFDGILVGPSEIESVLARHPAVAESAAFPLPSARHQDVPAVAVVLKLPLTMDELGQYCSEHLGLRAPRVFFPMDKLPRNPMGKVLRRELVQFALARLNAADKPA